MKKLIILILLVCIHGYSYAQVAKITGKILDSKSKSPLNYVTISCRDANNKIIDGTVTNQKGEFILKKKRRKKVFLSFQFIGYTTQTKEIELNSSNTNIGVIYLQEHLTNIDEIEIQAKTTTITQKIDRKVVNVGRDLTTAGTNAFEMLQNVPSVDINYLNNEITFRGSAGVLILIDGKPSNLSSSQLLKSIPSSTIKSVELISNPSAKYNPEGMSGIINIILKKNAIIGFNGSITTGIEHSKNTRLNTNLNLNYKKGIFNFYTNYNKDWGDSETDYYLNRNDKNITQLLDHLHKYSDHNFKIGTDIYLNKKNTLSLYTSHYFSNSDFYTNGFIHENDALKLYTPNLSVYNYSESAYNIDYKLNLDDKGHALELELNYSINKNPENSTNKETLNPNSKLYNYNNTITDNRNTWLINLDYTKPVAKGKLELGIEARIHSTFNQILTDQEIAITTTVNAPKGNTLFNYDRNIYSGYVNYNKDFKKFSFQTGLRFEQFNVEGVFKNTQQTALDNYSDNIFNIYPSAFLNYSPSEKNKFQASYSNRVNRPSIKQVTPIQEFTSPYIISVGNQKLTPQYTNSFEVNYTRSLTKGYFTFGLFYRKTSDKIGKNITLNEVDKNIQYISSQNYNNSDSYGIEGYTSLKPTKWWTFSPSFSLYIQDKFGILNNKQTSIKNTVFRTNIASNFKISKRLKLQISGLYRSKSEGIQFTVSPFYTINTAIRLSVLENKAAIKLRASDIFNTLNYTFSSTNPYSQNGHYILERNSLYLEFSYNFGASKSKKRNRKKRDKNETRGGLF
ncbi:outer membrane beta-barrel family protein [Tenacibaculum ovolyticum]|uniref:outer membrane beta-barrel family protein n=1 Tax=Tenacibaculum ovolyticum TaxID=104270 RepID=UPI0007EC52CB|nr:outer membrane beta-barrel family protein [Tenacibaculum ovolyticum]